MATFEPPSAEKLIFSDKTFACLIDCTPKHTYTTEEVSNVGIPHLTWALAISVRSLHEKALKGLSTC